MVVTGMGGSAQLTLSDNQDVANGSAALETDPSFDLLDSDLVGNVVAGDGLGGVIVVDGGGTNGNSGFQNLAGTGFTDTTSRGTYRSTAARCSPCSRA